MIERKVTKVTVAPGVELGGGQRLLLIAGPCVVESPEMVMRITDHLCEVTQRLDIGYVFKASYDKANRTAHTSFRSMGFEEALTTLARVRDEFDVPVLTDVHESQQVPAVAEVADVLQIPAFLCRQTDLLVAAGRSGRAVNIKKGQFMAPEDMRYAIEKVQAVSNPKVFLTERGSSFGYHNLVVDMRSLPIMRQFAPVVFDVTHSVQMPGGLGGASGGQREFAPYLARAAAAVGVDGFFVETHPNPDDALSDGPNMIPLVQMQTFLESLLAVWHAGRTFWQ